MRCLLYLLLCVALSSCLKRPTRIKPPPEGGTPPALDGSADTGNPPLIFDPGTTVTPVTTELREHRDAVEPSENTEKPPDTSTGGGKLIVNAPAVSDTTQLSAVVLTALCNNCRYPIKNDATELKCEIKGCRNGWTYVTHPSAPQHQHSQALCSRGDKTVADLVNLRLKCQFTHKKGWFRNYKHSDEFTLSKAIIRAPHLCVITEDHSQLPPEDSTPEVSIWPRNCDHHNLNDKKHKLALSFGW